MRRRYWVAVLVVLAVGVISYLGYQVLSAGQPGPLGQRGTLAPENVRTVTVRRGRLEQTVEATGNIAPARQQTLTFGISGTVKAVHVKEGDRVSAGTVLAELDTTELALQVRNAELSLRIQEAALAALVATPTAEEVAAAEAALRQAQANLEKVKAGPSKEELAAAEAAVQAAREAYQRLVSLPDPEEVERARLQLEQAKNSLYSAQVNRDDVCGKAQSNLAFYAQCKSAEAQVGNAEIAVKLAEIAYRQAQQPATAEQLANALAQLRNAEANLRRLQESPSAAEIAAAEAQVAQAQANLKRLLEGPTPEERAQAEARVEQARIALEQARQNLEKAKLVAAFDGIVAQIGFAEGDSVGPNGPGIVLVDTSSYYVDVQVNEAEIGQVQPGQAVVLSVDAFPDQPIEGTVEYVDPIGQSVQGVITYRVRITLAPSDVPILPGMTATARILTGSREEALIVPLLALRSDSRGDYVEVLQEDGSVRRVYVQVGARSNLMVEITGGDLKEGDQVIVPTALQTGSAPGSRGPFFRPPSFRGGGGR